MPRPRRIDEALIVEVFGQFKNEIIVNGDQIAGPANRCWWNISDELDGLISAKYAYTIVKQNRYNLWSLLGIAVDNNSSSTSSEDSSEEGSENETCRKIFSISFSPIEWEMLILSVDYQRSDGRPIRKRKYEILKPYEWTDVLHQKVFQETRLPCSISYKRAKIMSEGVFYLTIEGQCTSCNSMFSAIMLKNPVTDNLPAVLDCTYEGNFKICKGIKKRNLIGSRKKEIMKKLLKENKSSSYIRQKMANELMFFGDKEPSILPSGNQLRAIKCRAIKEKLLDDNPVISIARLKSETPYNSIIQDIGLERFFVHYWSSTEINNYREYCKRHACHKISIDATGNVVKKIKHFSGRQSAAIFLYEIVVHDNAKKTQFSVGHMLSELHDNISISSWLSKWLRASLKSPKIVVTDQSLALMMAVARTFTQFSSFSKYLTVCSELILGKTTEIPTCQIRNDVNHIMHLVSTWNPMKLATRRVKQFFMRSIALIVQSTCFEDIKLLLRYVFTVCLHEFDGCHLDTNEPTACERAKSYLKSRISGIDADVVILEPEYELSDETLEGEENIEAANVDDIYLIIQNIFDEVQSEAVSVTNQGDRDNAQYCPHFATKLLNFCKLLPVWSGVMTPIFGFGEITETSASSESVFNDIKNRTFHHISLPIRLDKFLKIHLNSINGNMKLVKSKTLDGDVMTDTHDTLDDEATESYSNAQENWKGLVHNKKSRTSKKTYLQKEPTIKYTNIDSKAPNSVIGVLKNGNNCDLRSIKINDQNYIILNTCSFDAVVQCLCVGYADSAEYKMFVEQHKLEMLFELTTNMIRDGVTTQTYRKRAIILKNLFPSQKTQQNIFVCDSNTTVSYLVRGMFIGFPSVVETHYCIDCLRVQHQKRTILIANLKENNAAGICDALREAIHMCRRNCDKCQAISIQNEVNIQPHILVEFHTPDEKSNFDLTATLEHIPTNITNISDGHPYKLRGVVNFLAPSSGAGIGHYVAYCYREVNDAWERYDDLYNAVTRVNKSTLLSNIQFGLFTL